jgi:hypothetical protein
MNIKRIWANKFTLLVMLFLAFSAISFFPALVSALNEEPDVTTKSATSISSNRATLNARVDGNGSSTKAWFEYGTDRDLGDSTSEESVGSRSTDFDLRISDLEEDTVYYFRVVAENDEGTDYGSILSFRTDDDNTSSSTSSLSAVTVSATEISYNSAKLNSLILNETNKTAKTWFEWGPTQALGNKTPEVSIGSVDSTTFRENIFGLAPGRIYYFRAVTENSSRRNNGSILSFTTNSYYVNNYVNQNTNTNTTATATVSKGTSATIISTKSISDNNTVTLEGSVNPNGYLTTAWFEYGTSKDLSTFSETTHTAIGDNTSATPFSSSVSNLLPNTTYYFRIVADNGRRTINGGIFSFTTNNQTSVSTTNNNNLTTGGTATEDKDLVIVVDNRSKIFKIATSQKDVAIGDEVDYFITFTNITNENLENVQISVELPKEVDFKESNLGEETSNNIIVYKTGTLFPSEEESMKIKAVVNTKAAEKDMFVTTAIMSYSSQTMGSEITEVANVVNNVVSGTRLGASTILSGSFLPSTLVDWLILILVVMCLIVVGRLMYKGTGTTPTESPKNL